MLNYKKISSVLLVFILCFSCAKNEQEDSLKKEIEILKQNYKEVVNELNIINENYVTPFKLYEENVLSEFKTSPDTIIAKYTKLIEKYPNSFWKHESERRIKNIKQRKHLWTKNNGWNLRDNDIPEKPIYIEQVISCPGC